MLPGAFWVAGWRCAEGPHWSWRGLREAGTPDVGFRCALDAELAYARLLRGEYVAVEEVR
jgi:hypothetical protein